MSADAPTQTPNTRVLSPARVPVAISVRDRSGRTEGGERLTPNTKLPTPPSSTILMCAPDYYGLKYEINPWMHRSVQPDTILALKQWRTLYGTLANDVGCCVQLVQQETNCPDMVFTANAGLIDGKTVLLSRFRHPQRQLEEPWFRLWFEENGFKVVAPPADLHFEGEGDALFAGGTILAGYLKRSDIGSHEWISETLKKEVISLELADSRWYHLDTCLCVLSPELIAFYPGAFDSYARSVLRDRFEVIEIDEDEALRFACNSVIVGNDVAMPSGCPKFAAVLEARGRRVHPVDMSEFIKAGGAAKCLVLFVSGSV